MGQGAEHPLAPHFPREWPALAVVNSTNGGRADVIAGSSAAGSFLFEHAFSPAILRCCKLQHITSDQVGEQ